MSYVLVTAARDEARYIEQALQSVVRQTIRPLRWVIVSDGSTDGTDDIVAGYAARHSWIELLRLPPRATRHFAAKAHAFNAGVRHLASLPYEFIGNLDADVSFGEGYFAFLLDRLAADHRLGVVGTPFEDTSLCYDYRFVSIEHVSGPCQLFRRACLDDIGGYTPARFGGVDHIAVITARMRGWRTRTMMGATYVHHRAMGSAGRGPASARFRSGVVDYLLGSHPLWEICRSAYQTMKRPYIAGGLMLLAGYVSAAIRDLERQVAPEFVAFHRREQMARLRAFLTASERPWGRTLSPARMPQHGGWRPHFNPVAMCIGAAGMLTTYGFQQLNHPLWLVFLTAMTLLATVF